MKRYIWWTGIVAVVLIVGAFLLGRGVGGGLASLPAPALSEGERGGLGIDKNINETTIDKYLNRPDVVYRDLRMLEDPANYGSIGGDSYLAGFIKGFEVVPFPYIVNVRDLPEAVGETYTGPTLFHQHSDGSYTANYEESMEIIEALFPKDKILFLMCGGGGYAGMMKNMLVGLGWEESKIYDVGGFWYYEGDNDIQVRRVRDDGIVAYDFYKVPLHVIDFEVLTEK